MNGVSDLASLLVFSLTNAFREFSYSNAKQKIKNKNYEKFTKYIGKQFFFYSYIQHSKYSILRQRLYKICHKVRTEIKDGSLK